MLKKVLEIFDLKATLIMGCVFFVALFFHADLAPLEETHWDAPIYVQLSKRAAETNLLEGYRAHAGEVQLGPVGAHWYFMRIGHILLLGEITQLFGSESALLAMQWLYRFFMAFGVVLCVVVGLRLVSLFRSERPDSIWWAGYAIAAATYVASDSFRGLQGHLVSEPPAFAILALFALVLLWAVERRSILFGALAGGLLFLLFFVRADAVLPGVIFSVVLASALAVSSKGIFRPCLFVAGAISLAAYLLYAWWFSPLVNPMTLAAFSGAAKGIYQGLPFKSLTQIVIAGGFLWVGASASFARRRDPVVRFAAAWLMVALFPLIAESLKGGALQVRMACFIALPLIILAGEGWAWILRRYIDQKDYWPMGIAVCILAFLAFTPYTSAIRSLREAAIDHLPPEAQQHVFKSATERGGIRPLSPYQDSRLGLLIRPVLERWSFDYLQAHELGTFLYQPERPAYVVWPRMDLTDERSLQEFMGLIRYFGKVYPKDADIVLARLPNKISDENCSTKVPTDLEPVVFCTELSPLDLPRLRQENIAVFVLGAENFPLPGFQLSALKIRFSAPPYTLYEVVE